MTLRHFLRTSGIVADNWHDELTVKADHLFKTKWVNRKLFLCSSDVKCFFMTKFAHSFITWSKTQKSVFTPALTVLRFAQVQIQSLFILLSLYNCISKCYCLIPVSLVFTHWINIMHVFIQSLFANTGKFRLQ